MFSLFAYMKVYFWKGGRSNLQVQDPIVLFNLIKLKEECKNLVFLNLPKGYLRTLLLI